MRIGPSSSASEAMESGKVILFKLLQAVRRRKATLRLTSQEREERNLARFRKLVSFVQEASPWYRRVIESQQIDPRRCRPEDFPILTSDMVRENLDDIVTDRAITRAGINAFLERSHDPKELFLDRYHVVHSSGSSGMPAYYVHTTDELVNGMSYGSLHRRILPRTRTTFIGILGEHKMSTAVMSLTDSWPERLLFNSRNLDVRAPWSEILAGLNAHQPQVVSAYKHVLMSLAEEARAGRLKIQPALLESGGEPLFRHERDILRTTFNCEVANSYGSSEVNLMGVALNDWEGIYLFEDDLIFELGAEFTCVTNLYNRALPLIRYRFDDILVPVEVASPRLPFRVVSEGIGRSQELISFPIGEGEERKFHILIFDTVDFTGLRRVEFEKKDETTLSVRVIFIDSDEINEARDPRRARLGELKAAIRQYLDDHQLQSVRLEVTDIGSIELGPESRIVGGGGKEKLILDPKAAGSSMPRSE